MSAPAALPCPYARAPDIHHLALPTCPAPASRPAGVPATDPRSRGRGSQWPPKTLRSPQSRRPHPPLDSARRARAAAGAAREAAVPAPGKAPRPPRAPAPRAALAAYVLRCAPAPRRPPAPLRPATVHPVTPAQARGQEGAREAAWAPVRASRRPGDRPRPRRPRRARPGGLLPRGQAGGGGRSAPAPACPLGARRPPRPPARSRAGPARRPGRRWPLVRGGRGSGQVPPPRLGRRAAVAADGYGNERLCLARSV